MFYGRSISGWALPVGIVTALLSSSLAYSSSGHTSKKYKTEIKKDDNPSTPAERMAFYYANVVADSVGCSDFSELSWEIGKELATRKARMDRSKFTAYLDTILQLKSNGDAEFRFALRKEISAWADVFFDELQKRYNLPSSAYSNALVDQLHDYERYRPDSRVGSFGRQIAASNNRIQDIQKENGFKIPCGNKSGDDLMRFREKVAKTDQSKSKRSELIPQTEKAIVQAPAAAAPTPVAPVAGEVVPRLLMPVAPIEDAAPPEDKFANKSIPSARLMASEFPHFTTSHTSNDEYRLALRSAHDDQDAAGRARAAAPTFGLPPLVAPPPVEVQRAIVPSPSSSTQGAVERFIAQGPRHLDPPRHVTKSPQLTPDPAPAPAPAPASDSPTAFIAAKLKTSPPSPQPTPAPVRASPPPTASQRDVHALGREVASNNASDARSALQKVRSWNYSEGPAIWQTIDKCLPGSDQRTTFGDQIAFFTAEHLQGSKQTGFMNYPLCQVTEDTLASVTSKTPGPKTIQSAQGFVRRYNELQQGARSSADKQKQFLKLTTAFTQCLAATESLTSADATKYADYGAGTQNFADRSAIQLGLASKDDTQAGKRMPAGVMLHLDGGKWWSVGINQFSHDEPQRCVEDWNTRYPGCRIPRGTNPLALSSSPRQAFNAFCGISRLIDSFDVQQKKGLDKDYFRAPANNRCVSLFMGERGGMRFGPLRNSTGTNMYEVLNCTLRTYDNAS